MTLANQPRGSDADVVRRLQPRTFRENPVALTSLGSLQGRTVRAQTVDAGSVDVDQYLGIPYTEHPMTKERRFQPSEVQSSHWEVRSASKRVSRSLARFSLTPRAPSTAFHGPEAVTLSLCLSGVERRASHNYEALHLQRIAYKKQIELAPPAPESSCA
jgi:hypothetical protein